MSVVILSVIVVSYWLSGGGMSFADVRLAGVAVVVGVDSWFLTVGVRFRCWLLIAYVGYAQFFHLSLPTSAYYAGIFFLVNWLTQVLTLNLLVRKS